MELLELHRRAVEQQECRAAGMPRRWADRWLAIAARKARCRLRLNDLWPCAHARR